MAKKQEVLKKVIKSFQNLPSNITQKSNFTKEITNKAKAETKQIVDKLNVGGSNSKASTDYEKQGDFVKSTPMPKFDMPSGWNKRKETERQVLNQVLKVRKKQAKDKGII